MGLGGINVGPFQEGVLKPVGRYSSVSIKCLLETFPFPHVLLCAGRRSTFGSSF